MKVLLHVCCGPCAVAVVERLVKQNTEVSMFYYNPNTWPLDEYVKRLESAEKVAKYFNVEFINPIPPDKWKQEHDKWKIKVKGLEDQPEGGPRCAVCYGYRLRATAKYANDRGYDFFATTLGMGPMKPISIINYIGREIGEQENVKFIEENWRKKGGYPRGIELSKQLNLYRQTYCGCEYSVRRGD
ncbi:epoxyqueuosine reductase QueH [Candidatus Micrarchaeota archaeon]|nr:epoxyqueuosine reductase QueH [Candidatus Micrarchaeota archaeon]